MATNRDTIKLLCKSIINRLENQKSISFVPRLRDIITEEVFNLVGPSIFSEQDLRDKTLAKMGAKAELLQDSKFTESEQYKAAKAIVRGGFGDDVLNGFYFQKPLKAVANTMVQYMMRSSHIDDVFETDEDLEKQIVEVVQKFNPEDLH